MTVVRSRNRFDEIAPAGLSRIGSLAAERGVATTGI
jgi:hypothetical protein